MSGYYFSINSEITGPLDINTVYTYIEQGKVRFNDWIWLPEQHDWYPLIEIPQLTNYFYTYENKPTYNPEKQDIEKSLGTLIHVSSNKITFDGQHYENRKFKRHPTLLAMEFSKEIAFSNKEPEIKQTNTEDISLSGIGFICDEPLTPGDTLNISIDIFPERFKTQARVVRMHEKENGYYIGAKFINTDHENYLKLKKFLDYEEN